MYLILQIHSIPYIQYLSLNLDFLTPYMAIVVRC